MSARQRGTPAYSLPDARRHSVRLSGVTVPRDLLARMQAAAGKERGALSHAVREALEVWLAGREHR